MFLLVKKYFICIQFLFTRAVCQITFNDHENVHVTELQRRFVMTKIKQKDIHSLIILHLAY